MPRLVQVGKRKPFRREIPVDHFPPGLEPLGATILYPMLGLSGLFAPVAVLPMALQIVARAHPMTYAVSLLQGIWVGEGWWAHLGDVVGLVAACLVCVGLSSRLFRWE